MTTLSNPQHPQPTVPAALAALRSAWTQLFIAAMPTCRDTAQLQTIQRAFASFLALERALSTPSSSTPRIPLKTAARCTRHIRRMRPTLRFAVEYMNRRIECATPTETFIETLRAVGLARIASSNITCYRHPLASPTPLPIDQRRQRRVDDHYVYINLSTEAKIHVLRRLAETLQLPLTVIELPR